MCFGGDKYSVDMYVEDFVDIEIEIDDLIFEEGVLCFDFEGNLV